MPPLPRDASRAAGDAPRPLTPEEADRTRREWVRVIRDSGDPEARRAAVREIHHAVSGVDPSRVLPGLRTVPWIASENFETRALRESVAQHLRAPDAPTRQAAFLAYSSLAAGPRDVEALIPMSKDPDRDVRKEVPRAILAANDFEAEGVVGAIFTELLRDPDLSVKLAALRALEEARRMAPEIEMMLFSMIGSGEEHVSFRALAALAGAKHEKDPQVIGVLAANLANEDPRFRTEARHGLLEGVPEAYHPQIANMVLPLLGEQEELADRQGNVSLLAEYGTGIHVGALERLAGDDSVPEVVRRAAREAIGEIEQRGNR